MDKLDLPVKWQIYEQEKAQLAKENLTPEEYTRKIVELCEKLEI
jgi:hypothetical protein